MSGKKLSCVVVAVSIAAVIVSCCQVVIAFGEHQLRKQEVKQKAADFVLSNSKVILSGTTEEQALLKATMEATFDTSDFVRYCNLVASRSTSAPQYAVWYTFSSDNAQRPPSLKRVFLHCKDDQGAAILDQLRTKLKATGYNVQGIQRVVQPTNGDVRYYHKEDIESAKAIASAADVLLAQSGSPLKLAIIYAGVTYPDMPRDVYEVWLPNLEVR